MVKKRVFSEAELAIIEAAVQKAELRTSGEIVVQVVGASSHYMFSYWFSAFLGFILGSGIFLLAGQNLFWDAGVRGLLIFQTVGAAIGSVLPVIPAFRRWLVWDHWAREVVHRACLEQFATLGLFETRDRAAVLLYVSLLERRVEILADRGIHEKVGTEYWNDEIRLLGKGLNKDLPKAIETAVLNTGEKLARYFPRRSDDRDEISNRVVTELKED